MKLVRITPGERGRKVMAYSELCMYMNVAGKPMDFLLKEGEYPSVQLYRPDGSEFSAPILPGDAGIFKDGQGYYYYRNDHGGD